MKINFKLIIISAILTLCLCLGGCGGTAEVAATPSPAPATPEPTPTPIPEPEEYELMGTVYRLDAESLDLTGIQEADIADAAVVLEKLEKVRMIVLGSQEDTPLEWSSIKKLHDARPEAVMDYAFTLERKEFNLMDEEMDIKYVQFEDEGELVSLITSCMNNLKYLDMDSCGISNESMAQLRDSLPNTEVVWRVNFGDYYTARTNVEMILASMPGKAGELTAESSANLKYCTKVKYLDLGHNNFLDTIEFVRFMPDLEVLIVGMSFVEDFTPLEDCPKLEYLEAMTTRLHDLSVFEGMKNLKHLNICYNFSIRDITPLYGLTQLERLWIGKYAPVPPEQIETIRELLPNCIVNDTTGDPTNQGWRFKLIGDSMGNPIYDDRYALLRQQFGGYDEEDFAFYWNDPLYYYGG